ncbi:MAG: transcriptional regulator NrdR [Pseudomonadota bacterium]
MKCPFCQRDGSRVRNSRPSDEGMATLRRRECPWCGARFSSIERIHLRDLTVVKRSGQNEPFNKDKLREAMHVALRRRPIENHRIEQAVYNIIRDIEECHAQTITSQELGEYALQALSKLDPVAVVRFASVYRDFKTPQEFVDFVEEHLHTLMKKSS